MDHEQANIERFNTIAQQWDADVPRVHMGQKVGRAMREGLQLAGDERVLEFGAGTGLATLLIAPKVGQLTVLDASAGMLDVLRAKCERKGLTNVTIVEGSLLTHMPAGPFDAIYSAMTLHHVQDVAALMRQLFTRLAPGGRVALADLDTENGSFHSRDVQGVAHLGFDRQEFGGWLQAAGFINTTFTTAYTVHRENDDGSHDDYPIFLAVAHKPV